MIPRDKALVLFDEMQELEQLTKDFDPQFMPEDSQELYVSFLSDLMVQLANLSPTSIFFFTDNYLDRNRWFSSIGGNAELRLLPGEDKPCLQITEALFSEGYRRLLFLTSLNPFAPIRGIQTAFQLLQLEDDVVVVGPTQRQSCYLLGIKTLHSGLMTEYDPRSSRNHDDAIRAICKLNVSTFTVEEWHDIVSLSDIERLMRETAKQALGNRPFPRRTREYLLYLEEKYNFLI